MNRVANLFKTKIGIHIDKHALHVEYKTLMSVYHPDKWSYGSSKGKEGLASEINTFYNVVKHDVSRCSYLLEEKGYRLNEKMVHMSTDNPFLEELLFMAEEVERITDKEELGELLNNVRKEKKGHMNLLHMKWESRAYSECLPLLHTLSYLDKIEFALDRKLR